MKLFFALAAALACLLGPVRAADAPDYIGSESCAGCHRPEAEAWRGSHHALAWTPAEAANITGDFDAPPFEHDGTVTQFSHEGGRYVIDVTEKDGSRRAYPVHSVVGTAPLQQYLLEVEEGRLQSFDVVWDTEKGEWFHLYPDQDLPPDDGLHWTGPYKNWNARCAECHATGYEKNYLPATRSYASVQAEIGVGCEACHGPGSAHVAGVHGNPVPEGLTQGGFTMDFASTGAGIEQCASCHSRREANAADSPLPGTPFHQAYNLALLRPGLYHADGQIEDEVYVYGSFLQSKMYARGVGCGDCHDPHSAELKAEGNALCAQCHSLAANPDFPSLRAEVYDDPSHHFHEAGTPGAQCKSCHMIERTYMGVDGRRDHSFRIPRPDLAAQTGGPDTCTDCHADQTPAWAAARIAERFPDAGRRGPHYSTVLAQGRIAPGAAEADLVALAEDASEPGIVRATALYLLQPAMDADLATRVVPLLIDADPLVRAGAAMLQGSAPDQDRVLRVVNLLDDPAAAVRAAAVRQILSARVARLPGAIDAKFRVAIGGWQGAMRARADFPETQLVLGGLALTMRNMPAARAAFREAVRMDPQRIEAWMILARITAATTGVEALRAVLDEALAINPDAPDLLALAAEVRALAR